MNTLLDSHVALQKDALHVIRRAAHIRIVVLAGKVWITEERDSRDHVLSRGEFIQVRRNGTVVLGAFELSSVLLCVAWNGGLAVRPARPAHISLWRRLLSTTNAALERISAKAQTIIWQGVRGYDGG